MNRVLYRRFYTVIESVCVCIRAQESVPVNAVLWECGQALCLIKVVFTSSRVLICLKYLTELERHETVVMEGSMDDSDLALEAAIIKIGSGDESSGSDNETEPPAPVAGSDADSIAMMNGGVTFQQGGERGCVEGDGGGERQPHALQIPRSQVTLNAIFSDYKLFTVFRRFLKDQCITRNLNFWLACNHYLQLPGGAPEYQEELGKVAKAIYVKYIKISAPQLVQVRQSTKRAIKSLLSLNPKTITPSLFKPAQEEAWELMKRNELKQFLASDMFREMFSEFDDDTSVNMAFQPSGPVLCSVSVEQSSSEDSRSMTSCSTE